MKNKIKKIANTAVIGTIMGAILASSMGGCAAMNQNISRHIEPMVIPQEWEAHKYNTDKIIFNDRGLGHNLIIDNDFHKIGFVDEDGDSKPDFMGYFLENPLDHKVLGTHDFNGQEFYKVFETRGEKCEQNYGELFRNVTQGVLGRYTSIIEETILGVPHGEVYLSLEKYDKNPTIGFRGDGYSMHAQDWNGDGITDSFFVEGKRAEIEIWGTKSPLVLDKIGNLHKFAEKHKYDMKTYQVEKNTVTTLECP